MGQVEKSISELSQYLEAFYMDVEAWLELADIYASCNQCASSFNLVRLTHETYRYDYSLKSLSHTLLLSPQNPIYTLQFAETAYTAGDFSLALKMFLVVVDMSDRDDSDSLAESTPHGITVRAWYGVKLVCSFPPFNCFLPPNFE